MLRTQDRLYNYYMQNGWCHKLSHRQARRLNKKMNYMRKVQATKMPYYEHI